MRRTATVLLFAMAAVFLLAHRLQGVHPAWPFVRAFAEAAMIGGIADWFAVTALFRHPLGLPIPHTAIIPRNKDRLAHSMAQFLRTNFLTPAVVARRLHALNIAEAAGNFLLARGGSGGGRIRAGLAQLLVEVLEALDPERLGARVRAGLARGIGQVDLAPLAGRMLAAALEQGRHRPMVDMAIRAIGRALEDNEALVRQMVEARANTLMRWTGLDERLARSVVDGLYRMLAEVLVDPAHPLRERIDHGLARLAHDLQHDPATRGAVERIKREALANPVVGEWWMGVWEQLRRGLIGLASDPDAAISGQMGDAMAELGAALRDDPLLQAQINGLARRSLVGIVARHGEQIVTLVSETVRKWDARTLSDRLERAVGRDLQFIRINGTLVGGLVGVTIHALTRLL